MDLVRAERIVVGPGHTYHHACHRFCDGARRVHNAANYMIRQALFARHTLGHHSADKRMKTEQREVYDFLPAAGAQRMIITLGDDWSSFRAAVADHSVNPGKYRKRPKVPGYAREAKTYVVARNGFRIKDGHLHLSGGRKRGFPPLKVTCSADQPFSAKADATTVSEVRIVPKGTSYVVELVHTVEVKDQSNTERLDPLNYAAIDLGIDNLLAIVWSQPGLVPVLVRGGSLKSVNAKWNKDKAQLAAGGSRKPFVERREESKARAEQSRLYKEKLKAGCTIEEARLVFGPNVPRAPMPPSDKPKGEPVRNGASKARHIRSKSMKRDKAMRDHMHKISRWLVDECVRTNTGTIVIGWNKGWKDEVDMGRVNNQTFVSIPYRTLIRMITYKAKAAGIVVIEREESYTSKASALDLDPIPTFGQIGKDAPAPVFSGRRVHRGLYRAKDGTTINADLNGAINILRKEVGDEWLKKLLGTDKGLVGRPGVIRNMDGFLEGRHRSAEAIV